jgi:hypothetical protein
MDPYIFKDFGNFDRNKFITKLREWEPHDVKTTNNDPINAVATAKNQKFQEKLKKAKDGKYCVKCEKIAMTREQSNAKKKISEWERRHVSTFQTRRKQRPM